MGNSTYQLIEDCDATNKALYKFYAAIMIVIFILALPLNTSVLHLFIFKLKFWKSNSNNIFLFNLVLADILLLFCLPIKANNFIQGERRSGNDTVCKAMLFMLFLNRGASIAFLTVTSIDRYFNVVHPGRKNLLKALKKSPQISILIWLFLLPLTVPTMLQTFECCNSHKTTDDDTLIKVTLGTRSHLLLIANKNQKNLRFKSIERTSTAQLRWSGHQRHQQKPRIPSFRSEKAFKPGTNVSGG